MEKTNMEARAIARYVRVSTRKTNQVLDLVRGRDVDQAMQVLTFTPKHVAKTVLKTLKSAVANATTKEARLHPEDLYVKECLCGPAPIMKRFLPRAQGRATPILKRSCHITIIVGTKKDALKRLHEPVAAPTAKKSAKGAPAPEAAAPKAAKKAPAKKAARSKSPLRPAKAPGR
jgi:large subunit ribosomal protein L22